MYKTCSIFGDVLLWMDRCVSLHFDDPDGVYTENCIMKSDTSPLLSISRIHTQSSQQYPTENPSNIMTTMDSQRNSRPLPLIHRIICDHNIYCLSLSMSCVLEYWITMQAIQRTCGD
eukprot:414816_1